MKNSSSLILSALACVFAFSTASAQSVDPSLFAGLKWRNIGPFRGGRVASVCGAIGQPGVFYMGMPEGGLWKTTNAGVTWSPTFDSVKDVSSVGAVAVAPSDPNIIYVGTGDMPTRAVDEGNGVYKSTDAGKTWVHLGLDGTKQIPSILVDPTNPDIVMVAAQGNLHKQSDDRGLYRSTDGGKTWTKTLFIDNETGIQKIAWANDDPSVMLLTTDRHYQGGGGNFLGFGGARNGPSGTDLYKSTDEGATWNKVDGKGLPDMFGRTCVAVAMHTNGQRMFLVGNFGLYRSDDGGDNWKRMDPKDSRVSNGQGGYNCGIYVNSANPDILYLINTSSYISTDGGNTFTGFKGAPGGDDPQQMWVDPTNADRLLFGTDQGATISLDGGQSWSSWYNQPTAQTYHISTDNRWPFWVYGTQQDSGCVGTAERGNLGEITPLDWLPHPGAEFGSIVADPLNPNITFAGGYGGFIKVTYPSGQWVDVSPAMIPGANLRTVTNQPLAFNPTNPHELLAGFQCMMDSTDGGVHWNEISPDLTARPKPPTPPGSTTTKKPATPAAPATGGGNSNEIYISDDDANADPDDPDQAQRFQRGGALESFSVSSVDGNIIWTGSDNGLIHVTRNHGHSWDDVTIPNLPQPERADIFAIDASHQDPATAYVAIDYHGTGDYNPYFYRTHDYGKTWTKIVNGLPTDLPSGSFARVIRCDTKKQGLLFAGTESSVYVSFDDGDNWQPLTLNLPNTACEDMVVHGNDLVIGTFGRSFWVLDDISPLRQVDAVTGSTPVVFFKPEDAIRVRRNVGGDTPFPPEVPHAENPPQGAIIDYYLNSAPSGPVTLDVTDSTGNVLRHYSGVTPAPYESAAFPPEPNFWLAKPHGLPIEVGENRFNWNLRCDDPPTFNHTYEINANPGETPASPQGPLVAPGVYTLTLTVDGRTYRQQVTVKNDPRSPASDSDVRAQFALQMKLYNDVRESWYAYHELDDLRTKIAAIEGGSDKTCSDAAKDLDTKIVALEGQQARGFGFGGGGGFRRGGGPAAPTFLRANQDIVRQLQGLDSGDMAPTDPMMKAYAGTKKEMDTLKASWQAMKAKDLPAFNAVLQQHNVPPVVMQ